MKLEDIQVGKKYFVNTNSCGIQKMECVQKTITGSMLIMDNHMLTHVCTPETVFAKVLPSAFEQWWKNWHGQVVALMIFAASFAVFNTLLRVFFPNP